MMSIERKTHLYEILYRFVPDGFQGAHRIDLERITEGGDLISERLLDAQPITEAEAGQILGEQLAAITEAATAARGEAVLAREAAAEAERLAAAAEAQAAALATENEELRAQLAADAGLEQRIQRLEQLAQGQA